MNYLGGFLPKLKFPTPNPPTAVAFQSLTANGTSGSVSTTQLTATFDVDPGLTTANFVVTGASKGTVSNVGAVYTININTITLTDSQSLTLDLINIPSNISVTPTTRTVPVYVADALEAPTFEFDLVFPAITEGDTGTFSAAYCFAGEIDSYSIASGTLPAWLTFNASTCVFTYTNAVFETVSGLSITATNAAGSATTNTADWVVAEDVVGQGVTNSYPNDYYAPKDINATGIVIDDITVFDTPDTVPKSIQLSVAGHITVAGTHIFDSNPIVPELDCDIRWLLTDENDNPLEDLEELINPNTGMAFNPYTDQIGFEFSAIGRLPQTYKAKVFVRGANGEFARLATFEKLIGPVSDNALPERWTDGVNGLDTNDGLSPYKWEGTATYTNATKRIFATGMFAGYDHAAATAGNYTNRYNVGYITGATESGVPIGQFKIAAKISDDEIETVDALGADYTGITFSTGPKLTAAVTNNTRHRVRGGSIYPTDPYKAVYSGELDVISYGGQATLQRTGTGSYVIDYRTSLSNQVGGLNRFIASNVVADGQWVNVACGGSNNSEQTESTNHVSLWDRMEIKRAKGDLAWTMTFSGANAKLHKQTFHWQNGSIDHRYLDSGATSRKGGSFMITNTGARWRFMGVNIKADGDDDVRDHCLYVSGDNTHAHAALMSFEGGAGLNYAINTNFTKEGPGDTKYISYVDNYITSGVQRGYDASKTNSGSTDQWGDIMLIARNKCFATEQLLVHASMKRARLAQNDIWTAATNSTTEAVGRFFGWDLGESPRYQVFSNNNRVYGKSYGYSTNSYSELYQFEDAIYTQTDFRLLNFHADTSKIAINNTNYYGPNVTGGNIAILGGVGKTITDLNAEVGASNISSDPGWIDPANGDFSTEVLEKNALFTAGKYATYGGINGTMNSDDDFELSFDFYLVDDNTLCNILTKTDNSSMYVRVESDASTMGFRAIGSTAYLFSTSGVPLGEWHSATFSRVAGQLSMTFNGVTSPESYTASGILQLSSINNSGGTTDKNLSVRNLGLISAAQSVNVNFEMDSESLTTEDSTTDASVITYYNILASDWQVIS